VAAGGFGKVSCELCAEQPDLKEIHQCEGGPEKWMILRGTPGQFEIDRCPMSYLDKSIERAFFLYGHYMDGRLPIKGGVLDQIHTGLEAFELISEYLDIMKRK
jgi:hypothetical protein